MSDPPSATQSQDRGRRTPSERHHEREEGRELLTKVEKLPCDSHKLRNTFRQELMRGQTMSEGTWSTKEHVEVASTECIASFDGTLNCVVFGML